MYFGAVSYFINESRNGSQTNVVWDLRSLIMKRFSFQAKLSLAFIALTVAALTVNTFFVYRKAVAGQKEELRTRILNSAKLASLFINGDEHSQIKPVMESQGTALYKQISGILKSVRDTDPLIDSVYTMVKSDKENIWMFVVDSGDKKRRIAYCGERYDVSGIPQMQTAFDGPNVDNEFTVDKWGTWLSGYSPIYNSQAQAVAIVGLDVSARSIIEMRLALARRFIWILISGIVFSLFMGWFVAKGVTGQLNKLILGVREVGRGNLSHKVNVESKDEIGELAGAFNKMTDGIQKARAKLQQHYLDTIRSLAGALEAKDPYTKGHSQRVAEYAVWLAKHLGCSKEEIILLEDLCVLHDIGKIGIPENILNKKSPLSQEEWMEIKRHPEIGEDILRHIEFLRPGMAIVRHHHERPDGKGYPQGLKEGGIPFLASIVSVADAFDAMTSDRSYRKAFTSEEAMAIIKKNSGSQFDRRVVDALSAYTSSNPAQILSGKDARVVEWGGLENR